MVDFHTGFMSVVEIREATVADAVGLAHVHTQSWREAYAGLLSADFLAARTVHARLWTHRLADSPARTATLVAVTQSGVVGFAGVGPELSSDEDGPLGNLYTMYLLADWWGRGIGHRLHTAAMNALVEAGFEQAELWVLESNARAIAFYTREGWRLDGVHRTERLGTETLAEARMIRTLHRRAEPVDALSVSKRPLRAEPVQDPPPA